MYLPEQVASEVKREEHPNSDVEFSFLEEHRLLNILLDHETETAQFRLLLSGCCSSRCPFISLRLHWSGSRYSCSLIWWRHSWSVKLVLWYSCGIVSCLRGLWIRIFLIRGWGYGYCISIDPVDIIVVNQNLPQLFKACEYMNTTSSIQASRL